MLSQMCGKNTMLVHKVTLKKKCKKVKTHKTEKLKIALLSKHFF